jgi:hypothetical protein
MRSISATLPAFNRTGAPYYTAQIGSNFSALPERAIEGHCKRSNEVIERGPLDGLDHYRCWDTRA